MKLSTRRHLVSAACAATFVLGLPAAVAQPDQSRAISESFAPGRIIVMPRPGLPEPALERMLKAEGGKSRRLGDSRLYVVAVPVGSERAIANKLAHNPHFKFAELDYRVAPNLVTNDPYLGSAWHLNKIGAPQAWDYGMGKGVTIAILDSGVDAAHPDLAPRLVPGWNFYDNNSNTADVYGHGTMVAGSAAAASNNGIGVASVGGETSIMPLRVTDTSGAGYISMIANGIIYAADRGVRVANASFAYLPSRSSVVSAGQYMKDKGGLVFVGAGNSGIDEGFTPTTSLVPVSATDGNDLKTSWSSYGNFVSLAAPGAGVYTTTKGGGYSPISGTSIASPVAAGAAAVVLSVRPTLTSTQLESILFSTAVDLGSPGRDSLYGYGRVNVAAAVSKALSTPTSYLDIEAPSISIAAPLSGATVGGLAPVDVSATDNVGVTKVELRVNGNLIATDTTTPFGFSWDTNSVSNGSVSLVATAFDAAGNAKASNAATVNVSNSTAVKTPDVTAPVVAITNPLNGSTVSGNVAIRVAATDDSGTTSLRQRLLINGREVASTIGGSLSYSWNTRKIALGSYTVQAVAQDASGNTSSTSVTVRR